MEFLDVVKNRYSCKKFDGRALEPDKLQQILEAGRLAPTAKNNQIQRIYVVQSAEGLAKIDKATPCRYNAPAALVVAFDKDAAFCYPGGQSTSGAEDASIVATHMMLAATALGVNSCWVNFFNPEELAEALALPANEQIVLLLDLGYAAADFKPLPPHSQRKALSDTVKYI